jgi:hypothetical protein
MNIHYFNVDLAKLIGLEKAILLQNIYFWTEFNKSRNKNFFENKYWTYNSCKSFEIQFPYMNEKSIFRYLNELKSEGYIFVANFNKLPYDKTKWYSVNYDKIKDFLAKGDISQNEKSISQNEKSISQNEKSISQNEKAIPDSKPDNIPDNKESISNDIRKKDFSNTNIPINSNVTDEFFDIPLTSHITENDKNRSAKDYNTKKANGQFTEDFLDFYKEYPKKVNKTPAYQKWTRLSDDDKILARNAIPHHINKWAMEERTLQYIVAPDVWLNQRRFEDETLVPEKLKIDWNKIFEPYRNEEGLVDSLKLYQNAPKDLINKIMNNPNDRFIHNILTNDGECSIRGIIYDFSIYNY